MAARRGPIESRSVQDGITAESTRVKEPPAPSGTRSGNTSASGTIGRAAVVAAGAAGAAGVAPRVAPGPDPGVGSAAAAAVAVGPSSEAEAVSLSAAKASDPARRAMARLRGHTRRGAGAGCSKGPLDRSNSSWKARQRCSSDSSRPGVISSFFDTPRP